MTYLCKLLLLFFFFLLNIYNCYRWNLPSHHSEQQEYDVNLVLGSGSHHGFESPPVSGSPYGFDAGFEPGYDSGSSS